MEDHPPAAGVFLFYGKTVLLCKRAELWNGDPIPYGGYWAPFTGAVEEGESPPVTASRELEEESGLKVLPYNLKYIKEISQRDTSLVLYAHELQELFIPVLNGEHSEFGYFKIADLDFHPKPLDGAIKDAIRRYTSILRIQKN